jgi:predicted nucleotidyltransferase
MLGGMWTYPSHLRHRLSPSEEMLLATFLERLHAAMPAGAVEAVRVFGSRARGDSDEHSDLDVAVLLREGTDRFALRAVVTDAACQAIDERDAFDLGLTALAIPASPRASIHAAIERDGFDIWRAPW